VVEPESFGAAVYYFTGSKQHNIVIREMAIKKGFKINEYGVFKGAKKIAGKEEADIFKILGLPYIPPELREARGELEAAKAGKLPHLVELADIKGDLHMHTKATDGSNTMEEMARAAKNLGYEYIAITDHSVSTRVAGGLNGRELLKNIKNMEKVSKSVGIRILKGSEVDILPDGSLDYPDELLSQLDIVFASVHSNFKMNKNDMTKRIIKAMKNRHVSVISHPTGRLIGEREAYAVDMDAVMKAAADTGTFMELNSQPLRLDLDDAHCLKAKQMGIMIAITTDAHATSQLANMRYGILTARRGWLEKKDILNCLSNADIAKRLARKKSR
jgi:DNA polymerase (family 10)